VTLPAMAEEHPHHPNQPDTEAVLRVRDEVLAGLDGLS